MLVLGIETSCDETSVAVVEDGTRVLSCAIASSRKDFESLGGVIPEKAARRQVEAIIPVIEKSLAEAKVSMRSITLIAVAHAPGLLGSLLVGTTTARVLASVFAKPLIGVHHTLGHLSSTWLDVTDVPQFPILTLSVSGGHTDVYLRESHTRGTLLGTTRDDAAGEAFDKGAVLLGLGYPGGPALSKLAETGDDAAYSFPLPLSGEDGVDFSFSGLKTSLKYLLKDLGDRAQTVRPSIAASYERAICMHLIKQLERAIEKNATVKEVHIVGGVSANRCLKNLSETLCEKRAVRLRLPATLRYCTDNGAMIAAAGYFSAIENPDAKNRAFTTQATLSLSLR